MKDIIYNPANINSWTDKYSIANRIPGNNKETLKIDKVRIRRADNQDRPTEYKRA